MLEWLFGDRRALRRLEWKFTQLERKVGRIMATQAEVAADLVAVKDKLVKIGDETTVLIQKVATLEAAVAAGGNATQEVLDALAAVKAQAQIVDDLNPDEVPPPTA